MASETLEVRDEELPILDAAWGGHIAGSGPSMNAAQKRLAIGLGVSFLGLVIALAFSTLIGVLLMAAGVVILGLLAAGYPSPRAVFRGERTLQTDDGDS